MNTFTTQSPSTSPLTFINTAPTLFTSSTNNRLTCSRTRPSHQSRTPLRMVSISRPDAKDYNFDNSFNNSKESSPTSAEVTAISTAVCEFMNTEHVRDIASYVINFGKKFDDFSQLTAVKMTSLDAVGFTTDIVSCDTDNAQCVCVQERFTWPLGLCHSANDVITALKHLSMACGLPADF